ncbi:hypothetical protein PV328_010965 [Microctonus aethiopoides]|uniref:Uncharacterized protein n=1 Tax=Microctonus aethiopoides TaxID=144406 RepID=A0AA39KQW5_9HYME|nr:hypothetical protein PV328_010965 [Microctonus aethiopoides]
MALCKQTLRKWINKQTEPISEISFTLILTQIKEKPECSTKLMDELPDNRPSAQELLNEIIEDKDLKIIQLTNENADKEA